MVIRAEAGLSGIPSAGGEFVRWAAPTESQGAAPGDRSWAQPTRPALLEKALGEAMMEFTKRIEASVAASMGSRAGRPQAPAGSGVGTAAGILTPSHWPFRLPTPLIIVAATEAMFHSDNWSFVCKGK